MLWAFLQNGACILFSVLGLLGAALLGGLLWSRWRHDIELGGLAARLDGGVCHRGARPGKGRVIGRLEGRRVELSFACGTGGLIHEVRYQVQLDSPPATSRCRAGPAGGSAASRRATSASTTSTWCSGPTRGRRGR